MSKNQGTENPMFGRTQTDTAKQKISESQKKRWNRIKEADEVITKIVREEINKLVTEATKKVTPLNKELKND